MEVILMILGFILTWIVFMFVVEKDQDKTAKIWFTGFAVFWWTVTYGVFVAGNYFGETTITKRFDVLEYERIVYSVPQTVTETRYKAPWWSSRNDNSYTVESSIIIKDN